MLTVVIPTWNEEAAIGHTLSKLLAQEGDFEVIVADGGSTDRTLPIAKSIEGVRVVHAPTGRGAAMNAGAAVARGSFLLFLHADTELPEGALLSLNQIERDGVILAGGFHQRFDSHHPLLRLVSFVHNLRARITRIFYGDQALFVAKRVFDQAGGFENEFMEDVEFGERLKRVCRPILMPSTIRTSARRFQQNGVIRSTCKVLVILAAYNLLTWKLPLRAFSAPVRGKEESDRATIMREAQNSLQGDFH